MEKLLLLSVLIATIAVPVRASRDKSARRGYKKTLIGILAFNTLYVLALRIIYPYISG
jgi:hypothetical protein